MEYLPVDKAHIPYTVKSRINGITFEFAFHYNAEFDYFTVALSKGGVLLAVRKMVYGLPVFPMRGGFPSRMLIPLDVSLSATRVGWDELQESVYLCLVNPDDWEGAHV